MQRGTFDIVTTSKFQSIHVQVGPLFHEAQPGHGTGPTSGTGPIRAFGVVGTGRGSAT